MTFEINELPMFSNGGSFFERIKNKFQRSLMASETSRRTMSILKSQAAISKEHHKHMDHLYMIHPFSRFRYLRCFSIIKSKWCIATITLDEKKKLSNNNC